MLGWRIFTKHEDCSSPEVLGDSYWMWGQCDRRCGQHQRGWNFLSIRSLQNTRAWYAESPFRGALQKNRDNVSAFLRPECKGGQICSSCTSSAPHSPENSTPAKRMISIAGCRSTMIRFTMIANTRRETQVRGSCFIAKCMRLPQKL